jgi:16S rRNA (uracil1498-N3)-methyltransferase
MSLPRFVVSFKGPIAENTLVTLDFEQARHLNVLRLKPGAAMELLLPLGVWKADLAQLEKGRAVARLVAPLTEDREPAISIQAWIPITTQLSLVDEMLSPLVELGATIIQPVVYGRSEYDPRKTAARLERWRRIVVSACEQSHRSRIPELNEPVSFDALLSVHTPQKWVAYEMQTGGLNPKLRREAIAFTSGPEGGITEDEFAALRQANWVPLSLGKSILRAVTAPSAMLGAIQYQLGQMS